MEINQIVNAVKNKGYTVFEGDNEPYNLNIVGVRSNDPVVNKFNDIMYVFWKYEGRWNMIQMQCTTMPGLHWLLKPINPKGCAILKEGQYKSCWKLDLHRGKYKALCQRNGKVTVFRDDDEDREYDLIEGKEMTGMYGINIHRASATRELNSVDKNSAGCQVIQDPREFAIFVSILEASAEVWGNKFTYTLINEDDIN